MSVGGDSVSEGDGLCCCGWSDGVWSWEATEQSVAFQDAMYRLVEVVFGMAMGKDRFSVDDQWGRCWFARSDGSNCSFVSSCWLCFVWTVRLSGSEWAVLLRLSVGSETVVGQGDVQQVSLVSWVTVNDNITYNS